MSENTSKLDTILVSFLRELANDIENKSLDKEKMQAIGEFYISWCYKNKRKVDNESDFFKFFTMGWYIYEQLLIKK